MCLFLNPQILYIEGGGGWVGEGGAPHINLYGEVLPKRVPLTIQYRLFHLTFFMSTFYMEKLRKIYRQLAPVGWKERLKMSNVAKFWKWLMKTDEDIGPQSREILQTFVRWGPAQTCFSLPHHAQRSVDFHNFAELYPCISLSNLAILQPLKLNLN